MGRTRVLLGVEVAEAHLQALRDQFPQVEFVVQPPSDVGAMAAAAADVDVIFTKGLPQEVVQAARALRWVQAGTAGINHLLEYPQISETEVVLTNARGAHGIPMAESILALALAFCIRLPDLMADQNDRSRSRMRRVLRDKWELHGQTMLVAGLGDIGGTLAVKAQALGMRVLGIRRHPQPTPGVDEVVTPTGLLDALGRADHVALCLPLTPETDGFMGERELRAMKPSAYIYNVGRGQSIDAGALLTALQEGWIAGAGLDVTDPEPLPADSPLWALPNVLLTQHSSGTSPYNSERICAIFAANLERYLAGKPLENVVDKALRY